MEGGEGGGSTGFEGNAEVGPEEGLGGADGVVGDEGNVIDVGLRGLVNAGKDVACTEAIGGDGIDFDIDGVAGGEGGMEGAGVFGFDGDNFDAAFKPGGDAGDESTAATGDEDGVEGSGGIGFPFEADGALAGHGEPGVVGMDGEGSGLGGVFFAGGEGLGVLGTPNDESGSEGLDAALFFGRGDFRDEDAGGDAEFAGGEGDGDAMIATGGGADTGWGDGLGEQVVKGAAGFEGAGLLEEFEFEGDGAGEVEVASRDGEEGRTADVGLDALVRSANVVGGDHGLFLFSAGVKSWRKMNLGSVGAERVSER